MSNQSILDFLNHFEALAMQKSFDLVAPLIHENAIFRFTDGDFTGRAAIRAAFEKTWASSDGTAAQEKFYLSDIVVLAADMHAAAASYNWNWEAVSDGKLHRVQGRGTRVLARAAPAAPWQIIHEHLSRMPKA